MKARALPSVFLCASAAVVAILGSVASAASIGVNFYTGAYTSSPPEQQLGPTDSAGVVSATHWNNVDANANSAPSGVALTDDSGSSSGVTLTIKGNGTLANGKNGYYSPAGATYHTRDTSSTNLTPTQILYNSSLVGSNNLSYGTGLILSGITYATYDIYVYMDPRDASAIEYAQIGSTTYYTEHGGSYGGTVTSYSQSTATTAADVVAGTNYVEFIGLTGASQEIDFMTDYNGSGELQGFQIVPEGAPVPEPASLALLGAAGLMLLARRRK